MKNEDDSLSLEKLKINERLQQLEIAYGKLEVQTQRLISHIESERGTMSRLHANVFKSIDDLKSMIEKLHIHLFGTTPPGIAMQLDRLVTSEERKTWHFRIIWATIVSILAKLGIDLFRKN